MDVGLSPDESLGQDQIRKLLRDAEIRLRGSVLGRASVTTTAPSKDVAGNLAVSLPKLDPGKVALLYINSHGETARVDARRLLNDRERDLSGKPRRVEDPVLALENIKKEKKATAGSDWFNLPRSNLTPELKRDLQLLKMRAILNPKRHYKKENGKAQAPEFSQVGTILQGPTEFFSSRLLNKDRKRTFVDEVLAVEQFSGRFKSKYNDVQSSKTSGKKAYYRKLMEQRSRGNERR
ncbi:Fcf2 pre-rRNA processing [Lasallia pustulata]|uniref:Fcf2 pre-rRNA processing n=1 Tax=Lasallia pustulata TaxID=136370 RepID=A0A1W5CY74_9LECA|nr:Fcf2 pre-rRNA processing [Lasallia pustulata]